MYVACGMLVVKNIVVKGLLRKPEQQDALGRLVRIM
jgi:hypothetical protein